MQLNQLLAGLEKRGIGEALLRGGEPMQTRSEGQWKPQQGASIEAAKLSAMLENGAPADAVARWQTDDSCQFEQNGFLIKAARRDGRVQIALKRQIVSTSVFTPTTSTGATGSSVATKSAQAPSKAAPLQPAIVEWFYLDAGAEKGPIAFDRVRMLVSMGTIDGATLVWRDGMTEWEAARDSDLRDLLPSSALNPTPTAPPLSPPVAPIASPYGNARPGTIGGGRIHEIPPSYNKFSIGAFALPLFWCASHNQMSRFWPIMLTNFIPCVGGFVSLYFGIQLAGEANSLAWVSRNWESVEQFEKTQKAWTIAGIVFLVLAVCVGIGAALLDF